MSGIQARPRLNRFNTAYANNNGRRAPSPAPSAPRSMPARQAP